MAKHQPINRNYEAGIWNKEEGPTPEQKRLKGTQSRKTGSWCC